MVLYCFFDAAVAVLVRMVSSDISPYEIVFVTNFGALVLITPVFFKLGWGCLKTKKNSSIYGARVARNARYCVVV